MSDKPFPSEDPCADGDDLVPASRTDDENPRSITPALEASEVKSPSEVRPAPGAPWWFWPAGFLVIFGVDAALVLALVAQHQDLAVAAGVPGALTIVALGVLRAFKGHMSPRR